MRPPSLSIAIQESLRNPFQTAKNLFDSLFSFLQSLLSLPSAINTLLPPLSRQQLHLTWIQLIRLTYTHTPFLNYNYASNILQHFHVELCLFAEYVYLYPPAPVRLRMMKLSSPRSTNERCPPPPPSLHFQESIQFMKTHQSFYIQVYFA